MPEQVQLDLSAPDGTICEAPSPKLPPPLKHGETGWVGNWQVRNFHGYHQSRECGRGTWQFHITGFDSTPSGQSGYCTVAKYGGGTEPRVPIDAKDRILIQGRRYGRSHWNH